MSVQVGQVYCQYPVAQLVCVVEKVQRTYGGAEEALLKWYSWGSPGKAPWWTHWRTVDILNDLRLIEPESE